MPEQSPNWEAATKLPLRVRGSGFHDGFPYDEGWPRYPWYAVDGAYVARDPLFEVVTAWGYRTDAGIDNSRQYMSEGTEWVIVDEHGRRRNIPKSHVAGWRRK